MGDGTYGITGIPPYYNTQVKTKTIPWVMNLPARKEINTLYPSNDYSTKLQWTLFILALDKFKALHVDDKLSYFQIAGIHGYPQQPWDGADPPPSDPKDPAPGDNPFGGYCHHNSITFPTWHRPYMLLYEKRLWELMDDVINDLKPDRYNIQDWKRAKDLWRLPYWDWARRQSYNDEFSLPYVFTIPEVTLQLPGKKFIKHPNPLWGFDNPEKDAKGKPLPFGKMPPGKEKWNIPDDTSDPDAVMPWAECTGLSRYGIKSSDNGKTFTGLEGVNNFETVNAFLSNFDKNWYNPGKQDSWTPPGTLPDSLNRMYSPDYNSTWGTFASTKWWRESEMTLSTGYMSLEYIHNNVHNLTGGSDYQNGAGQMSDPPIAAFDPIFWLHHCNVDRLLAIWQALKWDAWWDTPEPKHAQSNVPDPTPQDVLKPFHNVDNGDPKKDFWTSEGVRDWTKLLYTYDDLDPAADALLPDGTLNEEQYKKDLEAHLHDIYPSTLDYVERVWNDDQIDNPSFFGPIHKGHPNKPEWSDYIVNVVYDRYALNGRSYTIRFWLSNEPGVLEAENGITVGEVYVFGGITFDTASCDNCSSQQDDKVLSRAQVPLTIPILSQALKEDYAHIGSANHDEVETYLEHHLHWEFIQIGGKTKLAKDFPLTKVSVWTGKGETQEPAPGGKQLPPRYSNFAPIYKPTHGKEGGLRRDDALLGEGNFRAHP